MNLSIRLIFSFVMVVSSLSTADAFAQSLLGNTFNGILYDVDPATGDSSNPRATGMGTDSLTGIAFAPDGMLYGLTTGVGRPANSLVTINSDTGAYTPIGFTGLPVVEGDLAFDPVSDVLFGIQSVPNNRQLFSIDVATGAGTVVGDLGGLLDGDFSAMAFTPSGSLYILDSGVTAPSRLLTVDKSTAAIVNSVTLSVDLGFTSGMDFNPATGALYVADGGFGDGTDSLYTLDPATGFMNLVGPTGLPDGLAGLAFVIPEPTCMALVSVLGLVAIAMHRTRQSLSLHGCNYVCERV